MTALFLHRLTNSATSFALPFSDNLCTFDLSFSGAAETAFVVFLLSMVLQSLLWVLMTLGLVWGQSTSVYFFDTCR